MANLDPVVLDVNITIASAGIGVAGFGIPLIAARGLGGGFTERLRRYSSASAAAADSDLSASAQAAVAAAFAQPLSVNQVAIGRVEADAVQVVDFTVTGDSVDDDSYTITINGVSFNYTESGGGSLAASVAAALGAGLAGVLIAEPVTVSWVGAVVTVTADVAGEAFDYSSAFVAGAGSVSGLTESLDTANVSISTELEAINVDDPDWYGLTILSRDALDIERAAVWVEVNRKLFFAQSSDSDNLTTATTSIADTLKTGNYESTHLAYHFDDAEYADSAHISAFLAVNPDTASTTAAFKTLTGITPHTSKVGEPNTITDTQLTNLLAKNANTYGTLLGAGSTFSGVTSRGVLVSIVLSKDWAIARMEEGIATILLTESNAGRKVPLSDPGIVLVSQPMRNVVKIGSQTVTPPHFLDESSGTQSFTIPLLSELTPADKAANRVPLAFSVEAASEIQRVTINGTINVPGLS